MQSGLFNSVVVVGDGAFVLATSPESLGLVGVHLTSRASKLAIDNKKPFLSEPYESAAGNLIVLLSHPIFDKSGRYIGYIGGSIYLKKDSLFSEVLSQHFFKGDTEVSVVSNDGEVLFSKEKMSVGRHVNLYHNLKRNFNNNERGGGVLQPEVNISLAMRLWKTHHGMVSYPRFFTQRTGRFPALMESRMTLMPDDEPELHPPPEVLPLYGVLCRNRRNFRYPSFSPATSVSRSIISLLLWKV